MEPQATRHWWSGGGGGGSTWTPRAYISGGNGGSGVVVVRYQIASISGTAKASGGAISFYGGKTIHTFNGAGDFNKHWWQFIM